MKVLAGTLKVGQIVLCSSGNIGIVKEVLYSENEIWLTMIRDDIGRYESWLNANDPVTILDADFYNGAECIHRTYHEKDEEERLLAEEKALVAKQAEEKERFIKENSINYQGIWSSEKEKAKEAVMNFCPCGKTKLASHLRCLHCLAEDLGVDVARHLGR